MPTPPIPLPDAVALDRALRARRRRDGLALAEAAGLTDVGIRFLSELENGKPTERLDKLLRVVATFSGCSCSRRRATAGEARALEVPVDIPHVLRDSELVGHLERVGGAEMSLSSVSSWLADSTFRLRSRVFSEQCRRHPQVPLTMRPKRYVGRRHAC